MPNGSANINLHERLPGDLLVDRETGESRVFPNGCFEILGASIGNEAFCNAYTFDKARKEKVLLNKNSELDDPQVATRLFRNCAGGRKITHNMRIVPTHLHANALAGFDREVQKTFCKITGLLPDDNQWDQACLGFKHAGLGIRSETRHGEAAYLSSACTSRAKRSSLLATFSLDADSPGSHFDTNLSNLNAKLPDDKRLTLQSVIGQSQKNMSGTLDDTHFETRKQNASLTDRATIISESQVGAREFWQVVPRKSLGLAVPGEQPICEIRQRKRCPL